MEGWHHPGDHWSRVEPHSHHQFLLKTSREVAQTVRTQHTPAGSVDTENIDKSVTTNTGTSEKSKISKMKIIRGFWYEWTVLSSRSGPSQRRVQGPEDNADPEVMQQYVDYMILDPSRSSVHMQTPLLDPYTYHQVGKRDVIKSGTVVHIFVFQMYYNKRSTFLT